MKTVMTHPIAASGYTCSCDTSSQPSQYVICLQAWDILALCLFAIAVWLFNMECHEQRLSLNQQQQQQQEQQQSTTESTIVDEPAAVQVSESVTKMQLECNDLPGDESNVTLSLTNNLNRGGKSHLSSTPQRKIRSSRSRKLIKSNLKLTLSDPEDTDSEENLRSLDYSTNFMSINYPNTHWDNNNLPFDDVLNEQSDNDSQGDSKSKKIINRRITLPSNNFNNSAHGNQESSCSRDNLEPKPSNSSESSFINNNNFNCGNYNKVLNTTYCNLGHESTNDSNEPNCIKLTLDEVRHIRYAMTSAELDSLGVTESLKFDLKEEKICFACMKRRFSLFGSWGKRCHLCQRVTCSKCSSQIDVKDEHLNRVPVELLTPQLKKEVTNNLTTNETGNIQGPTWPPVRSLPKNRIHRKSKYSPRVCFDCQYFYIRASLD